MKLIFVLVAFIPLSVISQDSTSRIDERYLHTIVNIENRKGSMKEIGTGFIVGVKRQSGLSCYLVTNKHVISDNYTPFDPIRLSDSVYVSLYLKADKYKNKICRVLLKDNANNILSTVKLYPDPSIDVAVINVTNIFIGNPDVEAYYMDTSVIGHYENMTNIKLGLGSQIFALGYPAAQKLSSGNLAIAKSGYIASSLSGKTEYEMIFLNRAKSPRKLYLKGKFFIVDGLLIPGNSGSPIINPKEKNIYFPGGNTIYKEQNIRNYVVGIMSSGVVGTGLSIVYSSDYFLELIRQFPHN